MSAIHGALVSVPETATILFSGGIDRPTSEEDAIVLQQLIFSTQVQMEKTFCKRFPNHLYFCDRGTLDGAAYLTAELNEFCTHMGTTLEEEYGRYDLVIHMQAALPGFGYKNTEIRIESPQEAMRLDKKLEFIWGGHKNYHFVPNQSTFQEKLNHAVEILNRFYGVEEKSEELEEYLEERTL